MANDLSLDLRKAVLAHLRGDAGVLALVAANRIFGEVPDPSLTLSGSFIRLGYQDAASFEATGWDGSETDLSVHAFAAGPSTDGTSAISQAVIAAMETFAPAGIDGVWSHWLRTIYLADEVPDRQHAIIIFKITAFEIV